MNDSWRISIDKLMFWRTGAWVKYEKIVPDLYLRIYCDQLLITADNKVLESLNMQCKIKGVYKDDILILLINDSSQNIRKLKFQIKVNPACCYKMLGQHFPVVNYSSSKSKKVDFRYHNVNDVLKAALNSEVELSEAPADFKNFVKMCLLDPTFPNFVQETKNVISEYVLNK